VVELTDAIRARSVLISHSKQFVLFAPWKTASQTLRLRLGKYDESPYSPFFQFNAALNRVVHQHLTCSDFLALPESKLNYFKGAFVRNPYDRVYSGFIQLQRDVEEQRRATFSPAWVRELVMVQLDGHLARLKEAGFDFDAWWSLVPEHLIFEAGRDTSFPLHPCHYWTHVNQTPYVEFLGKVENFERDFQNLCQRLGLRDSDAGDANITTTKSEEGTNSSRYASRMSRASISKINSLFREDFSTFGYKPIPA
jgi:hypothetical protein